MLYAINGFFGKEVVVQDTGEKTSKVEDVVFDADVRQLVALLASGGVLDSTRVIRWDEIVSLSDVVVVRGGVDFERLKDDAEVRDLHKQRYKITGTEAIYNGEKLGTVAEIFVDDSGFVAGYELKKGLLSSNQFIPAEDVKSMGKDAITIATDDLPNIKDVKK